jgi:predicted TIM-barrel fold metal-dependent hydrolase
LKWFDAHCHVGKGLLNELDEQILLRKMDQLQIEKTVIVPWDQAIAVDNRKGNEYVADLARKHANRFVAFCTVNPWYGQGALEEIERAINAGAKGLKLHPAYQGFQLTDPIVFPVIEKAVGLGLPIYVPTGTPVNSLPLQLKYVADEYPEGVFIQGHFGSTDFWIDSIPSVINSPNIFVDTAYNTPSAIEAAIKAVGSERVIFSSDAPYLSLESEVEKLHSLHLPQEERKKIGYDNMNWILQGGGKR